MTRYIDNEQYPQLESIFIFLYIIITKQSPYESVFPKCMEIKIAVIIAYCLRGTILHLLF